MVLRLDIDREGKVTRAEVVEAVGHGFDEAALRAAQQLSFTPAKRAGQPIPARIEFRYEFKRPQAAAAAPMPADPAEAAAAEQASVPPMPAAGAAGEDVALPATQVTARSQVEPRGVTYRKLAARELGSIAGNRGDALAALENLPGVARPPALSGLLIVRGTSPESTQIFVDGTYVPSMYHFGGLTSVVPTEMLDHVDFYTGNYSPRYGRGSGGIVDIAIRRARRDGNYHGLAQLDLLDARGMIEGPMPLMEGWHLLAGLRRSHVDVWLIPLLEGQNTSFQAAPVYYDYQIFAETFPARGQHLRLGAFGSDDRLRLTNTGSASGGAFDQANAFWNVQAVHETALTEGLKTRTVASFGHFYQKIVVNTLRARTRAYPLILRSELSSTLSDALTLRLGPDLLYAPLDVDYAVPEETGPNTPDAGAFLLRPPRVIKDSTAFFRPGAFAELEMRLGERLRLTPGLRLDYSADTARWDASPRVTARHTLIDEPRRTTLKGGFGFFYEPPQPLESLEGYGNTNLRSIRALQTSLGVEQELSAQLSLSVEGFHIDLDDDITRRPNAVGRLDYQNTASGSVLGGELLLRYEPDEMFFGWLSYTLSRSRRVSGTGEPEVFFDFDQTHVLAAIGSYRLGRGWELGARFRAVSGNPFTPCVSGLYSSYDSNYLCVNGPFQSRRAEPFYQLDLRLEKRWSWSNGASSSVYLEIINATAREGKDDLVYNFDYSESAFVSGNLPLLPNLGLKAEF